MPKQAKHMLIPRKGSRNASVVAASIMRQKHGPKKFATLAGKGRRKH